MVKDAYKAIMNDLRKKKQRQDEKINLYPKSDDISGLTVATFPDNSSSFIWYVYFLDTYNISSLLSVVIAYT